MIIEYTNNKNATAGDLTRTLRDSVQMGVDTMENNINTMNKNFSQGIQKASDKIDSLKTQFQLDLDTLRNNIETEYLKATDAASQYAAKSHTHDDKYAMSTHTHNYAALGHTHAAGEVTGLVESLEGLTGAVNSAASEASTAKAWANSAYDLAEGAAIEAAEAKWYAQSPTSFGGNEITFTVSAGSYVSKSVSIGNKSGYSYSSYGFVLCNNPRVIVNLTGCRGGYAYFTCYNPTTSSQSVTVAAATLWQKSSS